LKIVSVPKRMVKGVSKVSQNLTKKESAEKLKSGYLDALINSSPKNPEKIKKSESSVSEEGSVIVSNQIKKEDTEENKF